MAGGLGKEVKKAVSGGSKGGKGKGKGPGKGKKGGASSKGGSPVEKAAKKILK